MRASIRQGAPDLVIEIVLKTTRKTDITRHLAKTGETSC